MNDPKIIETLDSAIRKAHGEGWDYVDLSIEDAREILGALRLDAPKVMALEEVEKYSVPEKEYEYSKRPPLYVEYNHERPIYIKWLTVEWLHGWLKDKKTLDYNRDNNFGWRCWTSRPSEEQMRETKWEES